MGFEHLMEKHTAEKGEDFKTFLERFWNKSEFSKIAPDGSGARWRTIDADAVTRHIRKTIPSYTYDPADLNNITPEQQKKAFNEYMKFTHHSSACKYTALTKDRQYQNMIVFCDRFKDRIPGMADLLDQTLAMSMENPQPYNYTENLDEIIARGLNYFEQNAEKMLKKISSPGEIDTLLNDFGDVMEFGRLGSDVKDLMDTRYKGDYESKEKLRMNAFSFMSFNSRYQSYMAFLASPISTMVNRDYLGQLDQPTLEALSQSMAELIAEQNELRDAQTEAEEEQAEAEQPEEEQAAAGQPADDGVIQAVESTADEQYKLDHLAEWGFYRRGAATENLSRVFQSPVLKDMLFLCDDGNVRDYSQSYCTDRLKEGQLMFAMNKEKPELGAFPVQLINPITEEVLIGDQLKPDEMKKPEKPKSPGAWERFKDWFCRTLNMQESRSDVGRQYYTDVHLYKEKLRVYNAIQASKDTLAQTDRAEKAAEIVSAKFKMEMPDYISRKQAEHNREKARHNALQGYSAERDGTRKIINDLVERNVISPQTASNLHDINQSLFTLRAAESKSFFSNGSSAKEGAQKLFSLQMLSTVLKNNIESIQNGQTTELSDVLRDVLKLPEDGQLPQDHSKKATDNVSSFISQNVRNDKVMKNYIDDMFANKYGELTDMIKMNKTRTQTMFKEYFEKVKEGMSPDNKKAPAYEKLLGAVQSIEQKSGEPQLLGNSGP